MDWIVGGFVVFGLLFFWGVWIFAYWLPMAKQAQAKFQREQAARLEQRKKSLAKQAE